MSCKKERKRNEGRKEKEKERKTWLSRRRQKGSRRRQKGYSWQRESWSKNSSAQGVLEPPWVARGSAGAGDAAPERGTDIQRLQLLCNDLRKSGL